MEVKQIYDVVNSVCNQALGTENLTVVDNQGIIALGNTVLSSQTNTDNFLNTLVQRIGKTIISYRQYRSMFDDLMVDNFTFGAIVQKIKISMPEAESDESYGLTDGTPVDMFKVSKPKAKQKLFVTETPYQIKVTIQRKQLEEAFLGEVQMGGFIGAVFGEVQNKIELSLEELGRNCLNNYIGEIIDTPTRAINLLAEYNTAKGTTLKVKDAYFDADFLRYAIGTIKKYSKKMVSMSTLYNDGTETRHTPLEMQRLYVLTDWEQQFETVVQYAAFNESYVKLNGFKELPFLQSAKSPTSINIKKASDGSETTVDNIICMLFDREALGIMKKEQITSTTPFNSAGLYYNTYWHLKDLYFNDLSENFILFYVKDDVKDRK